MKIAIIGAMDYEVSLLIDKMRAVETVELAGAVYHSGFLNGVAVVLAVSGIGKVNAALCAQQMIGHFGVSHVINSGIAGALKDHLNPLDVVVSTDLAYHDFDVTSSGGYKYGEIPRMAQSYFKADPKLVQLAERAVRDNLSDCAVYCDRIVSGDVFVASSAQKNFILKHFNAAATEMEGAAIGHTCHLNDVPFVVIRAISDRADGSADVDFNSFAKLAASHSATIVEWLIGQL